MPLPERYSRKDFVLSPATTLSGEAGTYWVYLQNDQPLRLTAWAQLANARPSLQYTFTKMGADEPVSSESMIAENATPIRLNLRGAGEGLYELKVAAAPKAPMGRIKVDFDAPAVSRLPAAKGYEHEDGYFFVPAGTKVFSVLSKPGRTTMLNANGEIMMDEEFDKEEPFIVHVPAGSDDQIWYYQGTVRDLTGVPPYVAARRDAMLVPAEVLSK